MKVWIAVFTSLIVTILGDDFDCKTLQVTPEPNFVEEGMPPFRLEVHPGDGTDYETIPFVKANQMLKVILKGTDVPFNNFMIQARFIMSSEPIGTWFAEDFLGTAVKACGQSQALIAVEGFGDRTEVAAFWRAPASVQQGKIEFSASVLNGERLFWPEIHSVEVTNVFENEENEVVPAKPLEPEKEVVDPHNIANEDTISMAQQQQFDEMMKQEDLEAEGDWAKIKMDRIKAHEAEVQWEWDEYEKMKTEMERQRQERIQFEMMDKEEHELIPEQNPEDEIELLPIDNNNPPEDEIELPIKTSDSGSSAMVGSLATILTILVAMLM